MAKEGERECPIGYPSHSLANPPATVSRPSIFALGGWIDYPSSLPGVSGCPYRALSHSRLWRARLAFIVHAAPLTFFSSCSAKRTQSVPAVFWRRSIQT